MKYMDIMFFFKQKTAYEMRISDWSSDVCSSDLGRGGRHPRRRSRFCVGPLSRCPLPGRRAPLARLDVARRSAAANSGHPHQGAGGLRGGDLSDLRTLEHRSEENTSELQ